jgi:hypothetical protein
LETAGRAFDRQTAARETLERELIISTDAHAEPVEPCPLKARPGPAMMARQNGGSR